jgi:gamma-glutamylcyclotransferase
MAELSDGKGCSEPSVLAGEKLTPAGLYYFAYGSNLNHRQMRARCASPRVVAVARLAEHQLAFFGHSVIWDGAEETVLSAPGQQLWGVVYDLSPSDRERLDDAQDARLDGSGAYFHQPATVTDQAGRSYSVLLYKKDSQGAPQKPSQEYLGFIVQGAVEHGLPADYIDQLRAIQAKPAGYAVPRPRKSPREAATGGDCSQCGDAPAATPGTVIHINLEPGSLS